ncbi:MAG: ArnT family glycosyltransferase [Kiritimatiellia bacterium]
MQLHSIKIFLDALAGAIAGDASTWALALAVPFFAAFVGAAKIKRLSALPGIIWGGLVLMAGAVIFLYVSMGWTYARSLVFWDHVEPHVASISWYFWLGKEVYPALSECYGLSYGPFLYIINGLVEALCGPSVFSAKLGGVLAGCGSVLAVFLLVRRTHKTSVALLAASLFVSMQLHFSHVAFWNRPDPFLVFFVSIAGLAATFPSWGTALGMGIAAGICFNLKIHALLYFLPIFAFAWRTLSVRQMAAAVGIGCAFGIAPFFMFGNISYGHFIAPIKWAAFQGFAPGTIAAILKWSFLAAMPVGLVAVLAYLQNPDRVRQAFDRGKWPLAALILAWIVMAIPASKIGSGAFHYMPFLPAVALIAADLFRDGTDVRFRHSHGGFLIYACLASWIVCSSLSAGFRLRAIKWRLESSSLANAVASEIQSVLDRYGDTHVVLMGQAGGPGAGGQYRLTFLSPLLVFNGMPIGLEASTLMERKTAGMPTPPVRSIGQSPEGKPVLWMIPKGDEPFSLTTWYPPFDNLYDDRFRQDFLSLYGVSSETPHFDLYTARSPGAK